MPRLFSDRRAAGVELARALKRISDRSNAVVLGLPRGGVIVAAEIAKRLHWPLDIVVTRKIGAPFNKELAIGAITSDGKMILGEAATTAYDIPASYITGEGELQQREAQRRLRTYRGNRLELNLTNQVVVLVDDGIATGLTMEAAIAAVKQHRPKRIIIAVPVAAADAIERLQPQANELVTLHIVHDFGAIGEFYQDFSEVTDDMVMEQLQHVSEHAFNRGQTGEIIESA